MRNRVAPLTRLQALESLQWAPPSSHADSLLYIDEDPFRWRLYCVPLRRFARLRAWLADSI